jgi:hypothetical protein
MTPMLWVVVAVLVAVGVAAGRWLAVAVRRGAADRDQAARRSRSLLTVLLAGGILILIVSAVEHPGRRVFDLAVAALMAAGLAADWLRGRRRRTLS